MMKHATILVIACCGACLLPLQADAGKAGDALWGRDTVQEEMREVSLPEQQEEHGDKEQEAKGQSEGWSEGWSERWSGEQEGKQGKPQEKGWRKGWRKGWEWVKYMAVGEPKDESFREGFDVSVVGAPSWSVEGKLGVMAIVSGNYRLDKRDTTMQPSYVSLAGNISITGYSYAEVYGDTYFKGDRSRLSYRLRFSHKPLDFWGISYEACRRNPAMKYTRQQVKLEADYVYKWTPRFHVGAALNVDYARARMEDAAYLEGQARQYFLAGAGASLIYDTRDNPLNPQRGVHAMVKGVVYPAVAGNHGRNVFAGTAVFNAYRRAWRGSVFALDLYGKLHGGEVPWALREQTGAGSIRMRGFYEGRFMDNGQVSCQVEWRQHLFGRFGMAVWGGGGWLFPRPAAWRWDSFLSNYGIGLRWKFKPNANVRLDYGRGWMQGGVVFGFGEAF